MLNKRFARDILILRNSLIKQPVAFSYKIYARATVSSAVEIMKRILQACFCAFYAVDTYNSIPHLHRNWRIRPN